MKGGLSYLNDLSNLLGEDVKKLDIRWNASGCVLLGKLCQAINESDDDVLHIDIGMEVCTGTQEAAQSL